MFNKTQERGRRIRQEVKKHSVRLREHWRTVNCTSCEKTMGLHTDAQIAECFDKYVEAERVEE